MVAWMIKSAADGRISSVLQCRATREGAEAPQSTSVASVIAQHPASTSNLDA